MSNENSTTNIPRGNRVRVGSNAVSGRSRKFCCITYLNELQIKMRLLQHSNQIRVWAYALHDKDTKEDGTLKEPHYHLIIVTYTTCTVTAIRRWFSGFKDENGKDITTTAQICGDVYYMYDYLTHDTVDCREQGKYLYDKSIIQSNDVCGPSAYFRASEESNYDNITLAAEMLLKGETVQNVAKRFGRDFILHYTTIKSYVNDVLRYEKYGDTLENTLQREYDLELYKLNYE